MPCWDGGPVSETRKLTARVTGGAPQAPVFFLLLLHRIHHIPLSPAHNERSSQQHLQALSIIGVDQPATNTDHVRC